MIRVFSHYFHKRTLVHVFLDLALIIVILGGFLFAQMDRPFLVAPVAVTGGLSLAACLFLINSASGFYRHAHNRSFNQSCVRAVVASLLALPIAYGIFSVVPATVPSIEVLKSAAMLGVAAVMIHRVYAAHSATQTAIKLNILVYGSGPAAQLVGETIELNDPHANVVGYVPGPNETESSISPKQLLTTELSLANQALALQVDEIVVALAERRGGSMPLRELLDCKLVGIKVVDVATYFEKTLGQIRIDYVRAGWLIFGDGFSQGGLRTFAKRTFDLICCSLLLILTAPLMVATIALIKLDSKGTVLYRQIRVGQGGRHFHVVKFRSMKSDAEQDGKPQWATLEDDRITRVGRVMRKFRIDELPQLFNVFRGDMSLVGPRPERPYFVHQLTEQIPYYAVRQSVKPGVTGWAQVRYHYGSTIKDSQEKLQFDLYYVKNHTLFLDMIILFETIAVVVMGKGAR